MQKIAVIGLGRFGMELARQLAASGVEVLAIDRSIQLINEIKDGPDLCVIARLVGDAEIDPPTHVVARLDAQLRVVRIEYLAVGEVPVRARVAVFIDHYLARRPLTGATKARLGTVSVEGCLVHAEAVLNVKERPDGHRQAGLDRVATEHRRTACRKGHTAHFDAGEEIADI